MANDHLSIFDSIDSGVPRAEGTVNEAYPGKVLTTARHFDETQGSDLGRGFSNAWNSAANDMTSGLSGYSSSAQGYSEDAANSYAEHRRKMQDLAEQTRPQDQSFREALKGGAAEFFGDYVPYPCWPSTWVQLGPIAPKRNSVVRA